MTGFSGVLVTGEGECEDEATQWAGSSRIVGPKFVQLPALTVGLLGVQVLWSVEMSQASPYLIRLGLSKSLTAIAFLAGPLSGLIVQPLIGAIADHSKSKLGRRRPYMLAASVVCAASMLLLGFTRSFVSLFTTRGSPVNDTFTIIFAVIALYGIDFSVNAVQAVDRALIVDIVPIESQPDANAWAARMLGMGSVIGFFIGNIELSKVFPLLGNTEIQIVSALSSILLLATQGISAASVREKVLVSSTKRKNSMREEIREIWSNLLTLPRVIRQICFIQFLAWIAWFPILFYTTVYIGDLYKSSQAIPSDEKAVGSLDDEATIIGSRAFFHFGLMALTANFALPFFVKDEVATSRPKRMIDRLKRVHLCDMWAFSHILFAVCMAATLFVSTFEAASILITVVGFSWAVTQWAPFTLLGEEILASSQEESFDDSGSIRLMEVRSTRHSQERTPEQNEGLWTAGDSQERQRLMNQDDDEPTFADNYAEASELKRIRAKATEQGNGVASVSTSSTPRSSIDRSSGLENENNVGAVHLDPRRNGEIEFNENGTALQNPRELHVYADDVLFVEEGVGRASNGPRRTGGGLQAKSGIIIGIHNLFIVIPQFLSTAIMSVIFALSDTNAETTDGDVVGTRVGNVKRQESSVHSANSVAIVFRLGGIAALLAFVLCWRLSRELKRAR